MCLPEELYWFCSPYLAAIEQRMISKLAEQATPDGCQEMRRVQNSHGAILQSIPKHVHFQIVLLDLRTHVIAHEVAFPTVSAFGGSALPRPEVSQMWQVKRARVVIPNRSQCASVFVVSRLKPA